MPSPTRLSSGPHGRILLMSAAGSSMSCEGKNEREIATCEGLYLQLRGGAATSEKADCSLSQKSSSTCVSSQLGAPQTSPQASQLKSLAQCSRRRAA